MTIVYRKSDSSRDNTNLVLSPHALIHHGMRKMSLAKDFLNNINKVIQRLKVGEVPWIVEPNFQYRPGTRYTMRDFITHIEETNIIWALRNNFAPTGPQFALVGSLKKGYISQFDFLGYTSKENPFCPDERRKLCKDLRKDEDYHVVLILGFYTLRDQPLPQHHSIEIRNTYGTGWAMLVKLG
ncbi:hypothetical protein Hanom_Chr04g00368231 [Helianthus anomalus]